MVPMNKSMPIQLSFLFFASVLFSPVAKASDNNSEFEAANKFYHATMEMDMKAIEKKANFGSYSYVPKNENGEFKGFKVVSGKTTLLDRKVDEFGTKIWLVHPVDNLTDKHGRSEPNRSIVDIIGNKYSRMSTPFVDINADGKLEAIVGSFSGGAHCCYTYETFSMSKPSKLLGVIAARDSNFTFADLDGDKIYEAIGNDMTFAYWNTSFAGSPSSAVILRLGPKGYKLALDLMRAPKPGAENFKQMVAESKKALEANSKEFKPEDGATMDLAPELWKNMLDLIYTGHSKEAWTLTHQAWLEDKKALFTHDPSDEKSFKAGGPDEFIGALLKQLKRSPYWKELKELNAGDTRFQQAEGKSKASKKVVMESSSTNCK